MRAEVRPAIIATVLVCLLSSPGHAAAAKKSAPAKPKPKAVVAVDLPKATQEGVVAWAERYLKKFEPQLKGENKESMDSIKTALFMSQGPKLFVDECISNLVSQLTLSLAQRKSFAFLVCASGTLVKKDPTNPRTANLFGAVLNSADKNAEAVPILEYAVSLSPKNPLLRLNLANAYLDANKDDQAKKILDKLVLENPDDCTVWKALSSYWWKKNSRQQFLDCLFKAARCKGYTKKKADKKRKKIEETEVTGEESPEQMEPKLKQLEDAVPFTSADVIEDEYPEQARQIRDKYEKLADDEQWLLPRLPMVNTNTPKDYQTNSPILEEWVKVFATKYEAWSKTQAAKMGINPNASDKVKEAQAKAAAQKQVADAMKQAQEMLKHAKNIPGMQGVNARATINEAMKKLDKAGAEQGVKLDKTPAGDDPTATMKAFGFDTGSPWAGLNYRDYSEIKRAYELYFVKYYKEHQAKVMDIVRVYSQRVEQENKRHDEEWARLKKEHENYAQQPEPKDANGPHGKDDLVCRREQLQHKKNLNAIGLQFYQQWVNLYMPQYAQKMKPNLDAYWKVCMLYIRNMNDPKVMEREFARVKTTHLLTAMQAAGHIGGGAAFKYYGETEEEERELEQLERAAEEEAQAKKEQFNQDFKSPEFDFSKWMEDHFVLEIAGQFFALKVTAKSIQFEANALIFSGTIKYNPVDNVLETSSGVTLKANIGVNICGVGGKIAGKVDIIKRTATWDLDKNTYVETTGGGSEVKFTAGTVSAAGKAELDSELNAKTTSKFTVFGNYTAQESATFK